MPQPWEPQSSYQAAACALQRTPGWPGKVVSRLLQGTSSLRSCSSTHSAANTQRPGRGLLQRCLETLPGPFWSCGLIHICGTKQKADGFHGVLQNGRAILGPRHLTPADRSGSVEPCIHDPSPWDHGHCAPGTSWQIRVPRLAPQASW